MLSEEEEEAFLVLQPFLSALSPPRDVPAPGRLCGICAVLLCAHWEACVSTSGRVCRLWAQPAASPPGTTANASHVSFPILIFFFCQSGEGCTPSMMKSCPPRESPADRAWSQRFSALPLVWKQK